MTPAWPVTSEHGLHRVELIGYADARRIILLPA